MNWGDIRKKILVTATLAVIITAAVCAAYLAIVLNWSYSKGERIGYVQKFSEKGWLCKTWEGELQMLPVPGALPEKFLFSVRDKAVVDTLNRSMGKKVTLHYEQHKGIPTSCFGESEYYVVTSRVVE